MSIDGKDECIYICVYMCFYIHRYTCVCVCVLKQFSEFRDRSDTFTLGVCNGCLLMVRMDVYVYLYICV
jgi:hypothetical protein